MGGWIPTPFRDPVSTAVRSGHVSSDWRAILTIERTMIGAAARLGPLHYGSAAVQSQIISAASKTLICLDLSNLARLRRLRFEDLTRLTTVTHRSDFVFWLLLWSALDKNHVQLSCQFCRLSSALLGSTQHRRNESREFWGVKH
jgi:hypothetical protein